MSSGAEKTCKIYRGNLGRQGGGRGERTDDDRGRQRTSRCAGSKMRGRRYDN